MDTESRKKELARRVLDSLRSTVRAARSVDPTGWNFEETRKYAENVLKKFERRTSFDVFKYVRPGAFLRELTADLERSRRVETREFFELLRGVADGGFCRDVVFSDNPAYSRNVFRPYFIAVNSENTVVTLLCFSDLYDVTTRRPKLDLLLKYSRFAGQTSPLGVAEIVAFLRENAFEDTKIAVRVYGERKQTKSANRCNDSIYNDVATAYSGGKKIVDELKRDARSGFERETAPTLNFEDGSTRSQRVAAEAAEEEGFSSPYYLAFADLYRDTIDYRIKPIKALPKEDRYHDYL